MTAHVRRVAVEASAAGSPVTKPVAKPRRDRTSWSARFADSPVVSVHHSETLHAKPTDQWPGRP